MQEQPAQRRLGFVSAFVCLGLLASARPAEAVSVQVDFRLYGTTWRHELAQDAKLHVEVSHNHTTIAEGLLRFNVDSIEKYGVLADVPVPAVREWGIIDETFSADFDLEVGDPATFGVDLWAGGNRGVWGFSTQTDLPGDIDPGNPLRGLTMTGIRLADGRPLAAKGLGFEFIPENTRLYGGFSIQNTTYSAEDTLDNTHRVSVSHDLFHASAAVVGGHVKLEVQPEPNPFIIDGASALVGPAGGRPNVRLIPEPSTFLLATLGVLGLALYGRRCRR